jgi:hypothetical protein
MENLPEQPKRDPAKDKQKVVGLMLFEAGIEFAVIIALPLIAFTLLGKWLDTKHNTHAYVIIGILLALAISVAGITKKIKDYQKILENK